MDDASLRLLDALRYYTAIAVERVALVAEAEHAEALRESDRVREALLASISHDRRSCATSHRRPWRPRAGTKRRSDRSGSARQVDFVQSQRIIANLIENAVRFSPAGAPIMLEAYRENDDLVFSVSDSGVGVPASERDRIFEPFYRAPATAADVRGVGLGLYIGRALAEAQGGSLTYGARPQGGSTFVLRLPLSDEEPGDLESELFEDEGAVEEGGAGS